MRKSSKSVRLVADEGGVIVVNPDVVGENEEVTLEVQEDANMTPMTIRLDPDTADAVVDAIDEARGRRRRSRRGGEAAEQPGTTTP